jgi:hypothetical protein
MATPLGHSIVGYAVARAAGVRSRRGIALAIGAANLPDVDFLAGYLSNGDVLSLHHEVITHKPVFPLIVGSVVGLAATAVALARGERPGIRNVVRPAALASGLVSTHVFMDPLPFPYDVMPMRNGSTTEVFLTQAWNAVIDMAIYGTLTVLALERNGNGRKAEA